MSGHFGQGINLKHPCVILITREIERYRGLPDREVINIIQGSIEYMDLSHRRACYGQ